MFEQLVKEMIHKPELSYDEDREGMYVYLVIPGRKKEDFGIYTNGEDLSILVNDYKKVISNLPSNMIGADNIIATYEAGILKIHLPYHRKEQKKSKKIEVG